MSLLYCLPRPDRAGSWSGIFKDRKDDFGFFLHIGNAARTRFSHGTLRITESVKKRSTKSTPGRSRASSLDLVEPERPLGLHIKKVPLLERSHLLKIQSALGMALGGFLLSGTERFKKKARPLPTKFLAIIL